MDDAEKRLGEVTAKPSLTVATVRERPPSKALTNAALSLAAAVKRAEIVPDMAYRDASHDDLVTRLPEFESAARAVGASRRVASLYGRAEARRLALSWAYAAATAGAAGEQWRTFWTRLVTPTWTHVSVANLANFDSQIGDVELAEGVALVARRLGDLSTLLEWSPGLLQKTLGEDWMRSGSSEYVLIISTAVPKNPDNIVQAGTGLESHIAQRALMGLRLAGDGDVTTSTLYTTRTGGPPIMLGHSQTPSMAGRAIGSRYVMTQRRLEATRRIYQQLADLEGKSPSSFQELRSALDRFRAAFDRSAFGLTDRVVDDVIALESIAAVTGELAYTVAVRVSGLLADSDERRVELFRLLKAFYAVRSTIVHGGRLKSSAQSLVAREAELRDVVRSVLRGFLNLMNTSDMQPTGRFINASIDEFVLDSIKRRRLRDAMGTTGWEPASAENQSAPWTTRQWADSPPPSATIVVPQQPEGSTPTLPQERRPRMCR